MEGSASAPALSGKVLNDEDYRIPSDGIGLTGHPKRVIMGPMSKDKGTYSSRINQIMRQADKCPGPGKYIAHEPWDEGKTAHVIHAGNKFPNGNREYKPMAKGPGPGHCENPNFALGVSISSSPALTQNPRVLYGKMPQGKRRSFLEGAQKHGAKMPFLGAPIGPPQKRNNKADTAVIKVMQWSKETQKSKSSKEPEKEIGPNHYKISYAGQEEKQPCHAIPKAKAQNFLDKAVKEKLVDIRNKVAVPGPGSYNVHDYDDSKFSRGTKYLQLRGMSRSAVSGYF